MKIGWALDIIGWACAQPFLTLAMPPSKGQGIHHLHDQSQDDSSTSSVEEYLHSRFQLGNSSCKFIVTVVINGISADMEADSGAECTTIPYFKRNCHISATYVHLQ